MESRTAMKAMRNRNVVNVVMVYDTLAKYSVYCASSVFSHWPYASIVLFVMLRDWDRD